MKGFKKDGKFRPTEKRTKSSLKKSDVKRKVSTTSGKLREKLTVEQENTEMAKAVAEHSQLSEAVTSFLLSKGMSIDQIKEILHESVDHGADNMQHLHETGRFDVQTLEMKNKDLFREKRSLDDDSRYWLYDNIDLVRKEIPEFKKYYDDNVPFDDETEWMYKEMVYDMPIELQHKIDDYYYTRVEPFE